MEKSAGRGEGLGSVWKGSGHILLCQFLLSEQEK